MREKTRVLALRVTEQEFQDLAAEAEGEGRTLSSMIRRRLKLGRIGGQQASEPRQLPEATAPAPSKPFSTYKGGIPKGGGR